MAAQDYIARAGGPRKFVLWVVVLLLLAGGLFWGLFYSVNAVKQSWIELKEKSARETLATLNAALAAYHQRHQGYPDTLKRLRGGEKGNPALAPPERAELLATPLAQDRFEKDGYRFRYREGPQLQRWAATVPLHQSYRLTAEPASPAGSGEWFYYTDQSGEIRARKDKAAGPEDPLAPSGELD